MVTSRYPQNLIGSLEWAFSNPGALLSNEKRSLKAPILKTAIELICNGLLYKLSLYPQGTGKIDLQSLTLPDSKIAQEAEQECIDTLPAPIITHSLRTFVLGMALSKVDEVYRDVDIEQFYVTCLLHDIAIESDNTHTCFAVAGGQRTSLVAHRSGEPKEICQSLGNAVSMHITPGINEACPGSLAALVSDASFMDLSGYKIWRLDQDFVRDVDKTDWDNVFGKDDTPKLISLSSCTTRQSRLYLADCWRRRALKFPNGRVALLEHYPPGLSHIFRCSPLR